MEHPPAHTEDEAPQHSAAELREQLNVLSRLPTGVMPRAEVVLVYLGERPAAELYLPDRRNAEDVIAKLHNIGLHAAITDRHGDVLQHATRIGVARSREVLDELMHTQPDRDHREYGRLMGYPDSAIDAFIGTHGARRLPLKLQDSMTALLPKYILDTFRFSRHNAAEELALITRWYAAIARYAPDLFEEQYSSEQSASYRKLLLGEDTERTDATHSAP